MSMKIAPKLQSALPRLAASARPGRAPPSEGPVEGGRTPRRTWSKDTFEGAPRKGGRKGLDPDLRPRLKSRPPRLQKTPSEPRPPTFADSAREREAREAADDRGSRIDKAGREPGASW